MPWRGAFPLVTAALAASGCEVFSLDGLTGDAGTGRTTSSDGSPAGTPEAGESGRSDASVDASVTGDAGAEVGTACDGGIRCNGVCVDPTSDPDNCNGCGNVCSTGLCGTTVTQSLATTPTGWTFNGSAAYNQFAPSAELTPATNYQAGTFVYDHPVTTDAFDVTFMFRMGLGGGLRSDGIGFMIEQSGAAALGATGAGLGMAGLSGYGVELDIYDNGECGDTSSDHVGVDDLTLCDSQQGTPGALAETDVTGTVDLADAHWHSAEVVLSQGALTVSVDGAVVESAVALPQLQTDAAYWFGFAGGTGGLLQIDGGAGGYRQEVKDIVLTFPTPRCL